MTKYSRGELTRDVAGAAGSRVFAEVIDDKLLTLGAGALIVRRFARIALARITVDSGQSKFLKLIGLTAWC